jgi:hypothetical protein
MLYRDVQKDGASEVSRPCPALLTACPPKTCRDLEVIVAGNVTPEVRPEIGGASSPPNCVWKSPSFYNQAVEKLSEQRKIQRSTTGPATVIWAKRTVSALFSKADSSSFDRRILVRRLPVTEESRRGYFKTGEKKHGKGKETGTSKEARKEADANRYRVNLTCSC